MVIACASKLLQPRLLAKYTSMHTRARRPTAPSLPIRDARHIIARQPSSEDHAFQGLVSTQLLFPRVPTEHDRITP